MTEAERYLCGLGISLLVHGALAGAALWLWSRPSPKSGPEPARWEVRLSGAAAEIPPAPVAERTPPPPEAVPEPSLGALTQPPAPAAPAGPGPASAAAPVFGMPDLALPAGGGTAGAIAVPVIGASGGSLGMPMAGAGSGERSLSPPDFGAGGAGLSPVVRTPPVYPVEARRKKIEGRVRMEFTVLEDGSVTDIRVRAAEPAGVFEQAAVAAIGQWKFSPAMENGKPVRKRAAQTLKFELNR